METKLYLYEPPTDEYPTETVAFGAKFKVHVPSAVEDKFFPLIDANPHFRAANEGEDAPEAIRAAQAKALAKRQLKELEALAAKHKAQIREGGFTMDEMHIAFGPVQIPLTGEEVMKLGDAVLNAAPAQPGAA